MDARLIIAFIGVIIVTIGAIISGDIGSILGDFQNQNLGYTLITLGGEVLIIYFIIDALLLRDEKRRWNSVKDKVEESIKRELTGVFLDVKLVSGATFAVGFLPANTSREETLAALRESALQKMKEISNDLNLLREKVDPLLLEGGYGDLFTNRARRLGDLQLKYWSKFLEPNQMALIIDLQNLLQSLDTDITIARKYEDFGKKSEISKITAQSYKEQAYQDLQALIKTLSEGVDKGMIEMW